MRFIAKVGCDSMSPMRPLRLCRHIGCNALVTGGYCQKHTIKRDNKEYDRQRGSAASRGYSSTWGKVRKMYLARYPLCEICQDKGKIVPAVLVHHKTPIKEGGALLGMDNMQSLCVRCHENIHSRDRWKKR